MIDAHQEGLEGIQGRSRDLPALEGSDQRRLLHNLPPGNVDQAGGGLHLARFIRADLLRHVEQGDSTGAVGTEQISMAVDQPPGSTRRSSSTPVPEEAENFTDRGNPVPRRP